MKGCGLSRRGCLGFWICFSLAAISFLFYGCSSSSTPEGNGGGPPPLSDVSMTFSPSDFSYLVQGEEQPLDLYSKKIAARTDNLDRLRAFLQTEPLARQPLGLEEIGRGVTLISLVSGASEEEILDLVLRLNQSGLVRYASPMFSSPSCRTVVTDEIVAKFQGVRLRSEIEEFAAGKNLRILRADYPLENCYLLGFTSKAGTNPLSVSRELCASDWIEYAHPNFLEILEPPDANRSEAEEESLVSELFVPEQNALLLYPNLFQEFDWIRIAGEPSPNGWSPLVLEDFEEANPPTGWWANEDKNPESGRYAWGPVSDAEYPSLMGSNYEPQGNKGWVAGSHDPGAPDLQPDMDETSEGYAPDMDTWLVYKADLSRALWARLRFQGGFFAPSTESFGWFVSLDGENWAGYEQPGVGDEGKLYYWAPWPNSGEPSEKGIYFDLTRVEGLGDLTGQSQVYIGFRFRSDPSLTPKVRPEDFSFYGVFLDNIRLEACGSADVPGITSDPLSNRQWGLKNTGQSGGTPGYDGNIEAAWALIEQIPEARLPSDPANPLIVAVLDEGVDLEHEDLNLVEGYDATYDPALNPNHPDSRGGPNPWNGHGTACAGIIGAKANGLGVVGVAPGVKIMPVRIAYTEAPNVRGWTTTTAQIADGMLWAARHGARILSNSWGGGLASDLENEAIRQARQMGCVMVFAAGNDNRNYGPCYPSSKEETIAVGAMSPCGERKSPSSCDGEWWWGSNYGNWERGEESPHTAVEVVAPGVLIATTDITGDGGYVPSNAAAGKDGNDVLSFNGTSSACPFVSGVLALMLSAAPELTPDAARAILHRTARDIGDEGWDLETGYGLVDAYGAVFAAASLRTDLRITNFALPDAVSPGSRFSMVLTLLNDGPILADAFYVRAYLSRDALLDETDRFLWYGSPGAMGPQAQKDLTANLLLPADVAGGSWNLLVQIDSEEQVPERDEENNLLARPIQVVVVQPPNLVVEPSLVDFGVVPVGSAEEVTIQIRNDETEGTPAPLTVTSIGLRGDPVFRHPLNRIPSTPFQLGAGQSAEILLHFAPSRSDTFTGSLAIESNDPDQPLLLVPLVGSAVQPAPHLVLERVPVDFGAVSTTQFFRIRNHGDANLVWTLDTSTKPSWITRIEPTSGTIPPDGYTDVILNASRNLLAVGSYGWNLPVSSNGGNATVSVTLTVPGQALSVSPVAIDFGQTATTEAIEIANTGAFGLRWTIEPDFPAWLSADAMSGGLDPGASVEVHLGVDRSGLAAGTYQHTVQIGSNGGSARVAVSMTVPSAAPLEVTAWADPTGGLPPLSVAFFAEATGGSPPYSFTWTFGDEGWSSEQNPEHVYAWPSEFHATVWVFDEEGNSASDEVVITVVGPPQ